MDIPTDRYVVTVTTFCPTCGMQLQCELDASGHYASQFQCHPRFGVEIQLDPEDRDELAALVRAAERHESRS